MTVKLPPEASRAGKNRHYHTCDAVDASRHYGVCLFTIEAFERGQQLNETPCVEAMRAGTCPAMAMRKQERDAGEALFYVAPDPTLAVDPKAAQQERDNINRNSASYRRGLTGEGWGSQQSIEKAKTSVQRPTVKPKPGRKPDEMIEFDAAALVNAINSESRDSEQIKQDMLDVSRPAAMRRRKAMSEGKELKPSVFDYMTVAEKTQLAKLRREMAELKMQTPA